MPVMVAVSDLHCGSFWGLCPPDGIMLDQGGVYKPNRYQSYLWDCWQEFVTACPSADVLVVNGDVVDGDQPRAQQTGIASVDEMDQARAAVEVLKPLREKAERLWLVRGTPYHEDIGQAMELIGSELGAEKWPDGRYSGLFLDRKWAGLRINIAHHLGSRALYKGTVMDRETLWQSARLGQGKVRMANLIIRSHDHEFARFDRFGTTVVLTPCWQLLTPFALKHGYFKNQPDIGGVIVDVAGAQVEVRPVLYLPFREPEDLTL